MLKHKKLFYVSIFTTILLIFLYSLLFQKKLMFSLSKNISIYTVSIKKYRSGISHDEFNEIFFDNKKAFIINEDTHVFYSCFNDTLELLFTRKPITIKKAYIPTNVKYEVVTDFSKVSFSKFSKLDSFPVPYLER